MFRLWGKIFKNNDIISDHVFELESSDQTKEEMTLQGIKELCYHFDIGRPMWFQDNKVDYNQKKKTRFRDHHFIESISFDYFEIEIIEIDEY